MADNAIANNNGAPVTFSTDEIAGAHIPRMKLMLGNDGEDGGTASNTNPLPVNVLNNVVVTVDALSSGIATDAGLGEIYNKLPPLTAENKTPVESLAIEAMLETLQIFMNAVLEKMPRLDGNDRLLVSHAESNPTVSIAASQSLASVGAANVNQFGGRDATHAAYALANVGALHLYDKITVS